MVVNRWWVIAALTQAVFAAAACGPSLLKGESPFVSVASLTARDGFLTANVNLRNINDVALKIDSLAITVQSRGVVLLQRSGPLDLVVDPNTTEDVSIEQQANGPARELLESLQSGAIESLPFSLDGRAHTAADGNLPFRHQGYLFRVPGRPGEFRATSTRAPEQD